MRILHLSDLGPLCSRADSGAAGDSLIEFAAKEVVDVDLIAVSGGLLFGGALVPGVETFVYRLAEAVGCDRGALAICPGLQDIDAPDHGFEALATEVRKAAGPLTGKAVEGLTDAGFSQFGRLYRSCTGREAGVPFGVIEGSARGRAFRVIEVNSCLLGGGDGNGEACNVLSWQLIDYLDGLTDDGRMNLALLHHDPFLLGRGDRARLVGWLESGRIGLLMCGLGGKVSASRKVGDDGETLPPGSTTCAPVHSPAFGLYQLDTESGGFSKSVCGYDYIRSAWAWESGAAVVRAAGVPAAPAGSGLSSDVFSGASLRSLDEILAGRGGRASVEAGGAATASLARADSEWERHLGAALLPGSGLGDDARASFAREVVRSIGSFSRMPREMVTSYRNDLAVDISGWPRRPCRVTRVRAETVEGGETNTFSECMRFDERLKASTFRYTRLVLRDEEGSVLLEMTEFPRFGDSRVMGVQPGSMLEWETAEGWDTSLGLYTIRLSRRAAPDIPCIECKAWGDGFEAVVRAWEPYGSSYSWREYGGEDSDWACEPPGGHPGGYYATDVHIRATGGRRLSFELTSEYEAWTLGYSHFFRRHVYEPLISAELVGVGKNKEYSFNLRQYSSQTPFRRLGDPGRTTVDDVLTPGNTPEYLSWSYPGQWLFSGEGYAIVVDAVKKERGNWVDGKK